MNSELIVRHFAKMGARAKVHSDVHRHRANRLQIDVRDDRHGPFFDIGIHPAALADTRVVDIRPEIRHLLLLTEQEDGKHKFLCGHDERHWFVAAVPEKAAVSTVQTAFDALKPMTVRAREIRFKVKPRMRNARRNAAFVRQGEWFFVPVASPIGINSQWILHNEPIRRGNGKPHMCEELVRQAGETVYMNARYPRGLSEVQYGRLLDRQPELRRMHWVVQRRNPTVFVRGKVRHADHKTIVLDGWHQVIMNTETEAVAMRHVSFID